MHNEGLPPEERYRYRRLTDAAKRIYLKMVQNFLRFDLSYTYREYQEVIDAAAAFEAIRWDYPEFFFVHGVLDVGRTEENIDEYYRVDEDGFVTTTLGVFYDREEVEDVLARLDAIYHTFDGITDPFELELAAYRYAIDNFEYEDHEEELSEKELDEIFTLAGLVKRGRGVCAAYTRFIQYILQKRGIPAVPILQNNERGNDESSHAWLAVMIDGEYYHLDVTFDEGDEKDPEIFPYSHFNVTDDEIDDDRDFDRSLYPDIICRATAANYYRRRGLFFETDDEAIEGARRFAKENEPTDREHLYFYFRMPPGHDSRELFERLPKELRGATSAKWIAPANDDAKGWYYIEFGYTKPDAEKTE